MTGTVDPGTGSIRTRALTARSWWCQPLPTHPGHTPGDQVPPCSRRAYGEAVGGLALSGPLRVWSGAELRRRWLSLVVVGILGGLAAGLAVAAFDGATRTETAYDRMRTQLLASDSIFFPSQVRIDDADISKLSQLPEVAAVGGF